VQQLVRFEGDMAGIRLPASGSLYLRKSMHQTLAIVITVKVAITS
jgi:hypothetical protein